MRAIITFFLVIITTNIYSQDLSAIYEKVNSAVVIVFTEEQEIVDQGGVTQKVTAKGLGSGFMISDTQLITAEHVVKVAENIQIQFVDGEIIPAKVKSSFKTADVALVELVWPKKNVTTVKFGDSDKMKVGERVFVIGAPYGLGHSLSSGYISGFQKNKKGTNPFTIAEYIQTDAAINTGNSGGPMFNMKGEVIGVVSQILTKSGGFNGIGFAATSNIARTLLLEKSILWGGTDIYPLTGKMATYFNLPQASGLLVQRVVFLSPLGSMGLQGGDTKATINGESIILGGDIILSINGIKFDTSDATLNKIADSISGRSTNAPLELMVLRAGKTVKLYR